MKTKPLCVILLVVAYQSIAQSAMNSVGARAMALGYASSTLRDEWSIHNNVSGLAKVDGPSSGFTYETNPSLPSFNRMAALFVMPVKKIGVAGAGLYRFGDALYNEQIISAGFANTMGLASLGIKVNYVQYHTESFGNKQAFTVSFGGIAELTPQLLVGAHIVNVNQPELSEQTREKIPTLLVLGLGFLPSEKLLLTSEVEKDIDHNVCWKGGIEYKVQRKFIARTGFNLHPQAGFAGLSFKPKKFQLDYAFHYHMNLSAIHQATIVYSFLHKK
jgi:hypothetical protein